MWPPVRTINYPAQAQAAEPEDSSPTDWPSDGSSTEIPEFSMSMNFQAWKNTEPRRTLNPQKMLMHRGMLKRRRTLKHRPSLKHRRTFKHRRTLKHRPSLSHRAILKRPHFQSGRVGPATEEREPATSATELFTQSQGVYHVRRRFRWDFCSWRARSSSSRHQG
jgi:hypothetical protein